MSEMKPISPLTEGFRMGESFSDHGRTQCFYLTRSETEEQFVLKHISIPESETKAEALILTGAVADEAGANEYYKAIAAEISQEAKILQTLSDKGIMAGVVGHQLQPKEGMGFDVYVLMNRMKSLQSFLQDKAITQLQALNCGIDLCDSLSALREEGYTYQNLKPENIFIDSKGSFRLGDLGLMSLEDLRYCAVQDHYLNDYSAPELFELLAEPNETGDIYALGMTLYYMFNGNHLPFDDQAHITADERREKLKTEALPAPKYADYELAAILAKACNADPDKRFATPAELKQALTLYMQRNEVHDHILVPPLPLEEEAPAQEAPAEENVETPEEVSVEQEPAEEAPTEAAEEPKEEEAPVEEVPEEEPPQETPAEEENIDELLASVSDALTEPEEPSPAAPDLEANEVADKAPEKTKKHKKIWLPILLVVLALGFIASAAVYFYSNWYLVTMNDLTVTERTADAITVTYSLSTPDPEMTWQCTDTYGNTFPSVAGEGMVRFTDLTPGTQYNISFYPSKLHKLLGTTSVSAATEAITQIVSFEALPGASNTTAELNMVVSGPEPEKWTLSYTSDSSDSGSVKFSGHTVQIPNLQLHATYTFELQPTEAIYLDGATQCQLKMIADVAASDLRVSFATEDSLTVTWESLKDEPKSWTVQCVGGQYDKTLEVNECTATFPGVDLNTAYTFTVSAEGMETPIFVSLPANAIVLTSLEAEPQDAGSVLVTWSSSEPKPENGWVVNYKVSGDSKQTGSIEAPEEESVLLSGLPANAELEVTLVPASGDSVIGANTLTVVTPEAGAFAAHDFAAEDSKLTLYPLPEKKDWELDDLGEASDEYIAASCIAVILEAPEKYKTRDKDETAVTIVFRDSNGKVGKYLTTTCPWAELWKDGCYMTSTKAPIKADSYQVELYFDNMLVSSHVITVTAAEQGADLEDTECPE